MNNVQNLTDAEGRAKLRDLAQSANICFFTTNLTQLPLSAIPMSTLEIDEEANFWFFSRNDSDKNADIQKDKRVQLFYANNTGSEYLSVFGEAEILQDKEKAKKLWTPIARAWFEDGVDDPHLTILKVTPTEAYYWDTKFNKMVSLFKMAIAAITGTGNKDDGGIQGTIKP